MIVTLTCPWEEIERRTQARGDRTLAEAEHGYRFTYSNLIPDYSVDTATASREQIAVQIATAIRGDVG